MSKTPKPPRLPGDAGQSSEPRQIAQPHDGFFRRVFSQPAEAAAFLRELLPAAISDRFAWDTLRRLPDTFVDQRLTRAESDLLFEVDQPGAEPPARVYMLIEHQSTPDPFMVFRLMRYCANVLEAAAREDSKRKRLPPVLPVVVYQGPRRWPYPTSLAEMLGESARDLPWGPRLEYLLLDQGAGGMSTVVGAKPGRAAQYLMLALLGPASERAAALERGWELVQDLVASGRLDDLEPFESYTFGGEEESAMMTKAEEWLKLIEDSRQRDVKFRGLAQIVWDDGQRKGHAAGHSEGIQVGEHRARVATVEGLLRAGVDWSVIQSATGLDRRGFENLRELVGVDAAQ